MKKKIKWNGVELAPVAYYAIEEPEMHWYVVCHGIYYVFLAEITDENYIELIRVSVHQHRLLKNLPLLTSEAELKTEYNLRATPNVGAFNKEVQEALNQGKKRCS